MNILLKFCLVFCALAFVEVLAEKSEEDWDPDSEPGTYFDFTVVVPPRNAECFFQYAKEGSQMTVDVAVLTGGPAGTERIINLMIYRPAGPPLDRKFAEEEHTETYDIQQTGSYEICLVNPSMQLYTKTVFLSVSVYHEEEWENYAVEELDALVSMDNLTDTMKNVSHHVHLMQKFQRHNQKNHIRDKYLILSNQKYVNIWSFLQCVAIIASSMFQVYFVRNLFSTKAVTPTNKPRA